MLKHNYQRINSALRASILGLGSRFNLQPGEMVLRIRIVEKDKLLLQVCREDTFVELIRPSDLVNRQLIALRLGAEFIEQMLRVLHGVLMKEMHVSSPERIAIIIYYSAQHACPIIGILQDNQLLKALRFAQVVIAAALENVQLN